MRRALLIGLVLLAAATGCGGSDDPAPASTTTIDSASSTEAITVAARAAAKKLPLVDITTSSATDDPNGLLGQPRQYVARVAWRDQRVRPTPVAGEKVSVETGGSMERFTAPAELNDRKQSLEATLGLVENGERLFVHATVLVRLAGSLTPAQAAEVDAALTEGLAPFLPSTTSAKPTATTRSRTTRPPTSKK
jgi:hypothetical protein